MMLLEISEHFVNTGQNWNVGEKETYESFYRKLYKSNSTFRDFGHSLQNNKFLGDSNQANDSEIKD